MRNPCQRRNRIKYTTEELKAICEKHVKWINSEEGGERANLYGANLREADLYGANLHEADLYGADLREANLREANLYGANLREANLCGADLYGANLYGANLYGANLYGANLREAENAELAAALSLVPSEGSIIGWKKAHAPGGGHCIVKLRIPEAAKRSSATGRKCRAEYAEVLEVIGAKYGISSYDSNVEYRTGQTVRPNFFDDNRWDECSNGIHFFITRIEAENYDL